MTHSPAEQAISDTGLAQLEQLANDPAATASIQAMQGKTIEQINQIIDDVARALAQKNPAFAEPHPVQDDWNLSRHTALARQRQIGMTLCRELAQQMVMDSLMDSQRNDDGDTPPTALLAALLQWQTAQ